MPMRAALPSHQFSLSTACRIGIEMLKAIESLHRHGFVHRDIKPGNFLIRPSKTNPIVLIDFGLARRYVDQITGEILPPRVNPGFVGTAPYASLNAHSGCELGRRDDLYSWFFSLLKIFTGELPWKTSGDKSVIKIYKENADIASFCMALPKQFMQIYSTIQKLEQADQPDYEGIYELLTDMMRQNRCGFDDPFDWEVAKRKQIKEITDLNLSSPDGGEPNSDISSAQSHSRKSRQNESNNDVGCSGKCLLI